MKTSDTTLNTFPDGMVMMTEITMLVKSTLATITVVMNPTPNLKMKLPLLLPE